MEFKMKIILADHAGFCFGVKRAVDMAFEVNEKSEVLGQLVHNPQVVERLVKKGVSIVDSLDNVKSKNILITAHGIPDSRIEAARRKGLNVIDTTCPFVRKVHNESKNLEKQGYQVVVVGEPYHVEVKGIIGNLKNPIVIEKPEDVDKLGKFERIGVVSQTTQSNQNFNAIVEKLKSHAKEVKALNTICYPTTDRQKAARELAKKVDFMLVIGGKNSGNTKRLKDICEGIMGKDRVRHIVRADDVDRSWKKYKTIGVTAGASTPDWIIEDVLKALGSTESLIQTTLVKYKKMIDEKLAASLKDNESNEFLKTNHSTLKNFIAAGGKRLRPVAMLMAYKGVGGKKENDMILPSLSVELFHNSTLVHDDVMDEDLLRRGHKSVHERIRDEFLKASRERLYKGPLFDRQSSRFAVTNAICGGNILLSLGCLLLQKAPADEARIKKAVEVYHNAYVEVNKGQMLDSMLETNKNAAEDDYFDMVGKKTGTLFSAAVRLGALFGGGTEKQVDDLSRFVFKTAIAFQLQDDILDISVKSKKGHEFASDIKKGKTTLLVIKTLENGSEQEKNDLLNAMGKHDASQEELHRAVDALYSSKAVKYAKDKAKELINEGKSHLEKASLTEEAYCFFNSFADMMLRRDV